MDELPPPGTPIDLAIIENRASLGQRVFSRIRSIATDQPPDVPEESAQWWFMLGWVTRGCAIVATKDDQDELVVTTFQSIVKATREAAKGKH
jgi:hypothetical protein